MTAATRPSLRALTWIWLQLGAQSFGGGSATLLLIRRAVVEREGWLSGEEFTRYWAICQLAPGINLLGLTVLIGWRLAGFLGALLALVGLLLPSVSITILLTAAYAAVRELPLAEAALRGVIPATVGLGWLLSAKLARPVLRESRREGRGSYLVAWAVFLGSGLAMWLMHPPVILLISAAGLVGAAYAWWSARCWNR